jgi:hypothetical protein
MIAWAKSKLVPVYEISSDGDVKLTNGGRWGLPGRIRKQWANKKGYKFVSLTVDGKPKAFAVHRLVLDAHVGPSSLQVNHKNGIVDDNSLENLEYVTAAENRAHAKHILDAYPKGSKHPNAKLDEDAVRQIFGLIDAKLSDREIARRFGCTSTNIWFIRHGKAWAHLSERPRQPNYKGKKAL